MVYKDINGFLKEHFDYSDGATTRYIVESGDDKVLMALTSKLYEKILEKYEKIDFSSISRSRGDITKIEKYDSLVECIDIITKLVKEYKEDTKPIDVLSSAMENIRSRTTMFKKAFTFGSPIPMMTYNTMALAIVECVSFMIGTCIEYIKVPGAETFQMALDTVAYNNTKSNVLFESLIMFNEGCATGEFDKAMEMCLNQSKVRREAAEVVQVMDDPYLPPEDEGDTPYRPDFGSDVPAEESEDKVVVHDNDKEVQNEMNYETKKILTQEIKNAAKSPDVAHIRLDDVDDDGNYKGKDDEEKVQHEAEELNMVQAGGYLISRGFFFIAKFLVPALRNLVYFFFSAKQKRADYYADMAQLVQMNMMELQNNSSIDVDRKKKILEKQEKIYQNYMRKKNKYSVDYMVSKKSVEKMIKDDDKKFTAKDVSVDNGTADTSGSILF